MPLSEQEIKSDLIQIRELSKIGGSIQAMSEPAIGSESEAIEGMMREESSDVDLAEQKTGSRSKNPRSKQQRKGVNDRDRSQRGVKGMILL